MELIDKSAIVDKIEKRMQELRPTNTYKMQTGERVDRDVLMWLNALTWVKDILNSIETKKVNLEEEFDRYCENLYVIDIQEEPFAEMYDCAKHFFELGLNAKEDKE